MKATTMQITVDIDMNFASYSDTHLAGIWHLAQMNPAPIEDEAAADLVAKLQAEIVSRWLRQTPPELYHHQQRHPYWVALTRFAVYQDGEWVARPTSVEPS